MYYDTFIKYIIDIRSDIEEKDIVKTAKKISLERGYDVMKLGDRLRKEGYEKGKEEAIKLGDKLRKEGYEKGKQEAMKLGDKLRKEGYEKGKQEALKLGDRIRKEGYQKGKKEGQMEALKEAARNFLKAGLTVEQVASGTRLKVAEVKKLQEELVLKK